MAPVLKSVDVRACVKDPPYETGDLPEVLRTEGWFPFQVTMTQLPRTYQLWKVEAEPDTLNFTEGSYPLNKPWTNVSCVSLNPEFETA